MIKQYLLFVFQMNLFLKSPQILPLRSIGDIKRTTFAPRISNPINIHLFSVSKEKTGEEVITFHTDISTKTGERVMIFKLSGDLEKKLMS